MRCTYCNWHPHDIEVHPNRCRNGHPRDIVGVYVCADGYERCRECQRANVRSHEARDREAAKQRTRRWRERRADRLHRL